MTFRQGGQELETDTVMEYVRFGVPVDIDIPDVEDVFDATDFAARGLQQELN